MTSVVRAQTETGTMWTKARYSRSLKRTRKNLSAEKQQQQQMSKQHQKQKTAMTRIETLKIPRFEQDSCIWKNGTAIVDKLLLVLDVNGVLCRRIRRQVNNDVKARVTYRSSIGYVAHTEVVPRTDLKQFLYLLDSHFALAIWSSAKRKTLKKLLHMLFPSEISKRLLFVWGQEKCDVIPSLPNINDGATSAFYQKQEKHDDDRIQKTVTFSKSLAKVFHKYPSFSETNAILIDDSPEKCPHTYRKNALHPPSISGIDTTLNRSALCMNYDDDDETNQFKQAIFFEQLANFWKTKSDTNFASNVNALHNFLSREARGHMGWKIEV